MGDLDSELAEGRSMVVNAHINKQGGFGYRSTSDVASGEEFAALLEQTRRQIGIIADDILAGSVAIGPYRLARQSPCPRCEFHSVCRFEPFVNNYRHLPALSRDQVLTQLQAGKNAR